MANNRQDISPNKRTARIHNGTFTNDKYADQSKKAIHVRNPSQYIRDDDEDSESDMNEKGDDKTYTKSDDDYEESFDKDSEESRNGDDALANGSKVAKNNEDYDDDNDLVCTANAVLVNAWMGGGGGCHNTNNVI